MGARKAATPEQVQAMERRLANLAVNFLIILGFWLILAPLVPDYTGYAVLERTLGGEGAVARFFVGFLFLYFAGIVREKNEVRYLLKKLTGNARAAASGQPEQARTAVELLINGLDAERPETRDAALENLKRLTGQDLGQDREAWQAWWSENRDTFQP